MTIRTVTLGGTDWSSGQVLLSADLNDTFNAVSMHRKVHIDAAEASTTSNVLSTNSTFDLSAPVTAIITGIYFECETKVSNVSTTCNIRLHISGTNLGDIYIAGSASIVQVGTDLDTRGIKWGDVDTTLFSYNNTSYTKMACNHIPLIQVQDTTTTFDVDMASTDNVNTAYIKNIVIRVTYVEVFADD